MVTFLVYDGSFPMDPALRILESYRIKADLGLYVERKAPLDETGTQLAPTLTVDQVRHSFGLSRILAVGEKDVQEAGDIRGDLNFSSPVAQLVSQVLATSQRDCELVYLVPPRPDNFYLVDIMSRLLNVFGINTVGSLAFSIQTETGITSEGLLSLLPAPAFEELMTDTDTVSLVIFFDLLGRLASHDWNVTDYPLTISKVSTIVQPALHPQRGKHRGFQGTYQRLTVQAEELRKQGILSLTLKDNFAFYSLTRFGRIVARVLQKETVLKHSNEPVREMFLTSEEGEERLRVDSILDLVKKAKTLGWIKP
ncbi:MAG: hypothetical protein JRN21_00670 [Nitrososphaerota archaeon]|nr:hypothetical protein [Nitrososphaerota archaeon]